MERKASSQEWTAWVSSKESGRSEQINNSKEKWTCSRKPPTQTVRTSFVRMVYLDTNLYRYTFVIAQILAAFTKYIAWIRSERLPLTILHRNLHIAKIISKNWKSIHHSLYNEVEVCMFSLHPTYNCINVYHACITCSFRESVLL